MKTIGLLGGMSWESTVTYYQIANQTVKARLGGLHSAKILLHSVDFAEIEACQARAEWDKSADILSKAACGLEQAGADFIVICTNTMHKVAPEIQSRISIPIIHIADATADELGTNGIRNVALLGTKYTMTQDFYTDRIRKSGIDVIIPDERDIETINRVIYEELCLGIISDHSKQEFLRIIASFEKRSAQGVILGCTEIGLLVRQEDVALPVFDTTRIHAKKAALIALGDGFRKAL